MAQQPQTRILEWCKFGGLSGLISTTIESLFILDKTISIPFDYVPILLLCNLLFWILLYAGAGFVFHACTHINTISRHRSNAPIVAVALFGLTYGFISKTGLFNYFPAFFTSCVDKHLSFVWVTCAIALAWFLKKRKKQSTSFPLSYAPDIAIIVALFHFCSNTHSFLKYIAGIITIFIAYFLLFIFEKWLIRKPIVTYIMLFIMALCFPVVCFLISSINNPLHNTHTHSISTLPKRPPVILIVLDTLRADRLSLYGGPVSVPNLEAFARDAAFFEHCIANSSWTSPSHASLFTGFFPSEHGCIFDSSPGKFAVLDESLITLAEIFQNQGYQTVGIVANFGYLGPGTNFNQGFQIYDCRKGIGSIFTDYSARPPVHLLLGVSGLRPDYVIPYSVAKDITKKAKQALEKFATQPFFLFINYMDPHSPYYPPLPYAHTVSQNLMDVWKRMVIAHTMGKISIYNSLWQSQYDGEIIYLDAQLGSLFAYMKKAGIYNKALIIVTSDHGEMFGEHGLADHRCELYQQVVHVPLIMKLPQNMAAGSREQKMITLRDVFYTIIDTSGIPVMRKKNVESDFDFPVVAEFYDEKFGFQQAFYYQEYKYMTYEKNKTPQLFNLKEDPSEQYNLINSSADLKKTIEKGIKIWRERHPLKIATQKNAPSKKDTDEDMLKRLRSLGYIK